jgi:hypothetical protein
MGTVAAVRGRSHPGIPWSVTPVACCSHADQRDGGAVAREATGASSARAAAGYLARRSRRRPRGARRPRRGQDRAARVRGRGGRGFRVVQAAGVEGEMELDYAALQQLCRRSSSSSSVSLILSVTRSASPSGSAPDRRPARISSGSRFSASSPKLPSSNRSCVWSTTRSGSTAHRPERSRSWLAACWRRGSRSRSRRVTWAVDWPASRSSEWSRWAVGMHGRCWSPSSRRGWTSQCSSGSSPRQAGIRSRSWSSRAD